MSYVPASESRDLLVVFGGVAALLGSLQWWSLRSKADPGRVIAVCADGSVIGAWDGQVRHRPRRHGLGFRRRRPGAARTRARVPAREDLAPGDLGFLRVREGRPGEAEWIVEGLDLGPEPFGLHWEFAAAEQALSACRLLNERIVRPPLDETGKALTLTDREFDAFWAVTMSGAD